MGGMGYRFKDPTGSGSNPDPDPQQWLQPHGSLPDGRGGEGGALHGRDGRSPEVALDERASQLIALVPVLRVSRHHVPAQFSQFLILCKLK